MLSLHKQTDCERSVMRSFDFFPTQFANIHAKFWKLSFIASLKKHALLPDK